MNSTRAGELAHAAIAHRFYVAFNARNLDSLDKFMAEDIVDHNPAPGQTYGLAGVKASLRGFFALSSDIQAHNDLVIAKGNYVTVYSTATGTQTGDLLGIKATNKPFPIHTLDIWRVRDGKLVEC
jgi:ketosteroid isomerase-like protein